MKTIDTYEKIFDLFVDEKFDINRWRDYIDLIFPNSHMIFIDDMNYSIKAGKYSYEKDFLPVINDVIKNKELLAITHESFLEITKGLDDKIAKKFNRKLNVNIVFYLGLCNGAGWVVTINNNLTLLLGIEKIMELNWCDPVSMYGLIYHELGHVYQSQYGVLEKKFDNNYQKFLWQLFVEGIAMHFEQLLMENNDFFHQDNNDWKKWCDENIEKIKTDFTIDLQNMTAVNQKYFGDWCSYYGRSDVGYYLGSKFVSFISKRYSLDEMINLDIDIIDELYQEFIE